MAIYTPSTLQFEIQRCKSQSSGQASNLRVYESTCTQCNTLKTRKNGKLYKTRSGARRFVCADCTSHAAK